LSKKGNRKGQQNYSKTKGQLYDTTKRSIKTLISLFAFFLFISSKLLHAITFCYNHNLHILAYLEQKKSYYKHTDKFGKKIPKHCKKLGIFFGIYFSCEVHTTVNLATSLPMELIL
jgi:hypothetical protein